MVGPRPSQAVGVDGHKRDEEVKEAKRSKTATWLGAKPRSFCLFRLLYFETSSPHRLLPGSGALSKGEGLEGHGGGAVAVYACDCSESPSNDDGKHGGVGGAGGGEGWG